MNSVNYVTKIIYDKLMCEEEALTAAYFDAGRTLLIVGILFAVCGFVIEPLYAYIHTAPTGFYTIENLDDFDNFYTMLKWVPFVGIGLIAYYVINYSNVGDNR